MLCCTKPGVDLSEKEVVVLSEHWVEIDSVKIMGKITIYLLEQIQV